MVDTFVEWKHNGKSWKESTINAETKVIIRIDNVSKLGAEVIRGIDNVELVWDSKKNPLMEIDKECIKLAGLIFIVSQLMPDERLKKKIGLLSFKAIDIKNKLLDIIQEDCKCTPKP